MSATPTVAVQPLTFPATSEAAHTPVAASPEVERLAAIDIGSNSIHMVVAEAAPDGGYRLLGREREMVRLGKTGLGEEGSLSEAAMQDGLEALAKMTTIARLRGAERVVAVATSAVREAANGGDFLARVKAQTGLDVRLLTGVEEGQLIFRAVREVVDLGPAAAVIIDVGGGSTEWITSHAGELGQVVSLTLGSLRCAADLAGDPVSAAALDKLRRKIDRHLAERVPQGPVERLIATSGTAVCCADLIDYFADRPWKEVSGAREVRTRDLAALVERLRPLKRRQLADLPPVGGPRSDSLLAGAVLLQALVTHAGVDRFLVSDRALREGLVLAALGQPIPPAAEPEDLRRRQVLQLAGRAETVYRHNRQTARLAVRLFDLTASLHGLGVREREWLEYAALLHDIGYSIHYRGHHKHAYYLITNAVLDAFDQREIEIIANVARYHRGSAPKASHPNMAALKPWQQRAIRKLAALLRVADALDRTHASRVDEIYCAIRGHKATLEVLSRYSVDLELEEARQHARLFAKVFDCDLRLRQGLEVAG
ncbi:MAG TPA: Ppx/GppA phosphatase family protein [Thermoanaerobaculia bacterium]